MESTGKDDALWIIWEVLKEGELELHVVGLVGLNMLAGILRRQGE